MFEQNQKIVQVVNDPILNNLSGTENKLDEINQEVGNILDDYTANNTVDRSEFSFFNFNNPFFLLTLLGLIILFFALLFLKKELKNNKSDNRTPAVVKKDPVEYMEPRISYNEKKSSSSKVRKIKVVKIK